MLGRLRSLVAGLHVVWLFHTASYPRATVKGEAVTVMTDCDAPEVIVAVMVSVGPSANVLMSCNGVDVELVAVKVCSLPFDLTTIGVLSNVVLVE